VPGTAVQRFYRFHARVYDGTRWMILHGRRRAIEHLGLRPDSQVLEIGCGTGLSFPHILERLDPQAGRLTGIDFSPDMLRKAERRVRQHGWPNVELILTDATTLSLGRQYDAVFFAYSLNMIPDWQAALARAHAHLTAGGHLVVLDFGRFDGWGPLAPLIRACLRCNHVQTQRPYESELRRLCDRLEIHHWLGGYNFIAVGQKIRQR